MSLLDGNPKLNGYEFEQAQELVMDREAWRAWRPWDHKELDMTE